MGISGLNYFDVCDYDKRDYIESSYVFKVIFIDMVNINYKWKYQLMVLDNADDPK